MEKHVSVDMNYLFQEKEERFVERCLVEASKTMKTPRKVLYI